MTTKIREEQCLLCKGTGQRSWLYRYWEDLIGVTLFLVIYIEYWDGYSAKWKIGFITIFIIAIISMIIEKRKNLKGKCKNCNGTGKVLLEEVIEQK